MDLFRRLFTKPQVIGSTQPDQNSLAMPQPSQFEWPTALNPFLERPDITLYHFLNDSPDLVIIIPGYNSNPAKPKYSELVDLFTNEFSASVIVTNNPGHDDNYGGYVLEQLRLIIKYAIRMKTDAGLPSPRIKLLGSSAGGSGVAAISGEFPEIVDEIFLLGPSLDVPENMMSPRAVHFTGKVNIIRGEHDEICSQQVFDDIIRMFRGGTIAYSMMKNADHGFTSPNAQRALVKFIHDTRKEA